MDKETGRDKLQVVNREDVPFDFEGLLAAMRDAIDAESGNATADEGIVLQIIKEPVPGVRADHTYALSYTEAAVILEKHSKKEASDGKLDLDALVMATTAIEDAATPDKDGDLKR